MNRFRKEIISVYDDTQSMSVFVLIVVDTYKPAVGNLTTPNLLRSDFHVSNRKQLASVMGISWMSGN